MDADLKTWSSSFQAGRRSLELIYPSESAHIRGGRKLLPEPRSAFVPSLHLPIVKQAHNHDAAHDVAHGGKRQPMEVLAYRHQARKNRAPDFAAAGDAVGKVALANHEAE